jgi:protein transport protein SEC24
VGAEFCTRATEVRPVHLFALDATDPTLLASALAAVLECARSLLVATSPDAPPAAESLPAVGFFVYDKAGMYFFSPSDAADEGAAVHIVSDMDDPFAAMSADKICVAADKGGVDKLGALVQRVPALLAKTAPAPTARGQLESGAALEALADATSATGGKAYLIASQPPRVNKGALRNRDNLNYYSDREEEVSMFLPVTENSATECGSAKPIPTDKIAADFYTGLAAAFAKSQTCLDIFLVPNSSDSCDVATLSALTSTTGGQLHLIPASPTSLHEQFRPEIVRSCTRNHGNDVMIKVRTSKGVKVSSLLTPSGIVHTHAGSFELEMASLDADKSVVATVSVDSKGIANNGLVYFQSATLFTSKSGQRTVRVSTLAVPSTSVVQDVFRGSDFDAIACVLTRQVMTKLGYGIESASDLTVDHAKGSLVKAREHLISSLVDILAAYRLHTSASKSPSGQLILPETLKLLPLFILSMLKNPTVRASLPNGRTDRSAPPSPRVDARAFRISLGCNSSALNAVSWAHPMVYDVSKMAEQGCGDMCKPPSAAWLDSESQEIVAECMREYVKLPPTVHPSISVMQPEGVYLISDGFSFYLYVGRAAGREVVENLFGVQSGDGVDANAISLLDGSELGGRLTRVMWEIRRTSVVSGGLKIVFAGNPTCSAAEGDVMALLVDDNTIHEVSYVDFLCAVHRKIQAKVVG